MVQHNHDAVKDLSPRQQQVLQLIAQGFESKEIAAKLKISHRTVEVHRVFLRRKLGATNTASLLRAAIQRGLVVY